MKEKYYSHQKKQKKQKKQSPPENTRKKRTEITRKRKRVKKKQLSGSFKQLTSDISHAKTWTWLKKGNLQEETESLQIAAQNNAIRTNHMETKIDKTKQNDR